MLCSLSITFVHLEIAALDRALREVGLPETLLGSFDPDLEGPKTMAALLRLSFRINTLLDFELLTFNS